MTDETIINLLVLVIELLISFLGMEVTVLKVLLVVDDDSLS